VNYVLNHYARISGAEYDAEGATAAKGNIHTTLLDTLNQLDFYTRMGPKSLGREWVEQEIFPLMEQYTIPVADKLRTYCEHVAIQTGKMAGKGKMLVTGGGVFNTFLLNRMKIHTQATIHIPETRIVNYKEAIIFALLGVLYCSGQINCLSSVTGAKTDNTGGALYRV
jgi:anhydro-N-acetylmuramic acid kinase